MAPLSSFSPHSADPSHGNGPARVVLSEADVKDALVHLCRQISQRNPNAAKLALIGLPRRGVTLAQRISAELASTTGVNLPVGQIDVTFHRDDLELHHPVPQITSVPFDITGLTIILVDDVLFSGRTVRAALTAINDLGRPEAIQLATLIDRGHRRLPIAADFIGRTIETDYLDDVAVKVKEIDGLDCVEVSKP